MSEQTSPLHDPSGATRAAASRRPFARPRLDALSGDRARWLALAALVGILVFAGFLRLNGINWDNNGNGVSGHLHPDERFLTQISASTRAPSSVANYFDTKTSALNPYNIRNADGSKQPTFVYGTLPLFMNKFFASHLQTLTLGMVDNKDNYDGYNLSGRALSALFDLATTLLVFLLGRELLSRNAGLLAAFLYAASAFPIQNAHFFVVDPYVTFFATAAILFAVRSAKRGRKRDFALAGVSAGLAAATKITAVSLLPVIVLAIGVYAWPGVKPYVAPWWYGRSSAYARQQDGRRLDASVGTFVLGSLIALVSAFVAFRIAMPYAFNTPAIGQLFAWHLGSIGPLPVPYPDIMNQQWLKDEVDQQRLLSGNAAFPPDVQWIGRSKWVWPLQQMVSWGMGPALGITAWLGVLFAIALAFRTRQGVWLVPLAWVLGYFGFMGAQFSLYMRYFLPLYPTLTVLAAVLLWSAWQWSNSREPFAAIGRLRSRLAPLRPALPYAVGAGVSVVVLMTLFMGLAFYHIYSQPVTRADASRWIYQNVPAGSVIGHESWDDVVPYEVGGATPRNYGSVTFDNFSPDTPQRVQQLLSNIDQVDYIALASGRVSETVTRVPAAWPVTSRYYAALADGSLGFRKVAEFNSYPELFGIKLNDTGAEESYTVYDHPKVIIYKKTSAYSAAKARQVLGADAFVPGVTALPGQLGQNAMQFTPAVAAKQAAGGTWSSIFQPGNVINDHPLIFWLLAIEVAAFSLLPLTIVVFRGLPDRGFLLTKPLGVLALAYLAYAPASRGAVDYTRGEIAGVLGFLVLVGIATGWFWRREVVAFVRERWRFLLFCEALFLLLFIGSYWIRLQNPDLWHPARGGEKPMDFAYLNGVIRTTDLSQGPIDPWQAGGYLNYYYFGQFIAATVTKLTGIVPEVAYNLIIPMFFALAGAATFSLAYNLAESTRRLLRRRPGRLPISIRGPLVCGVLAVFLVLIAGNLRAVGILEQNFSRVSPWHANVPLLGGIVAFVGGFKALVFGDASFRQLVYSYDWWAPSRALGVVDPTKEVQPITEFPFWTFLFADLHAHLMAIPFALTSAAVGLGAVLNFSRLNRDGPRAREVTSWLMVLLLALIVGALRWINSWDFPPFLLLAAAALVIGERAKEGRMSLRVLVIGGFKALVMAMLTYVFFAPLIKNYNMFYSGFHQSDQTTALGDYLSQFGILLFLVAGLVLFQLNRAITRSRGLRLVFFGHGRRRADSRPVMLALLAGGAAIIWAGTLERWGVTLLAAAGLVAVLLCVWRELRSPTPTAPAMLYVYGMVALGLGLSGGVEVLTLDGDVGRMNTVFKFYEHVWLLWGVVGAFSLWYVVGVMQPQEAFLRRAGELNGWLVRTPRYAFGAAAAGLLVLALAFPYFGTRARVHDRFNPAQGTGNNGMAYMDQTIYRDADPSTGLGGEDVLKYDRDGINWMRSQVKGTPTIIEGITPIYRYGSRVSIYTGLPDVLGWDWHQTQQRQRFAAGVAERKQDVDTFYNTSDVGQARAILREYNVQYVIVGAVERNYYPGGMAKFQSGLDGALELSYQNPGMQIWHVVPQAQLAQAAAAR
ncbi:MAG: glycosyltransferase family 39 protein [Dehalococcoidia bacterium]|nr:glycosyltransferase family 39 protein [Dehalococcoidia bacterium]